MPTIQDIPRAPGGSVLLGHAGPLVRDSLAFVSSLPVHGRLVRMDMGTADDDW